MKRVFLVHGWGGRSDDVWFPWLKRELEKRGFVVMALAMPDTETPRIEEWVSCLSGVVGEPDSETYLVGHSIGCQTIVRYLEGLPEGKSVGGILLVAGFAEKLTGLTAEEMSIAKPWLETPIQWGRVKRGARRFIALHSDNDRYIPLDTADFFKEKLGAEVIIEHGKDHFASGITELPAALEAILKLAGVE
ncbi:MAG: serine hydrolase family protein [Parcubacteria group bacterium]|nr:serine hydrolase family protein [Parcubacteria group bacterium]